MRMTHISFQMIGRTQLPYNKEFSSRAPVTLTPSVLCVCVLSHPSPAEFVEVLSEVRRVEERLRPFIERTHSILGAATSADYNNNVSPPVFTGILSYLKKKTCLNNFPEKSCICTLSFIKIY